jgi:hypothetical protein
MRCHGGRAGKIKIMCEGMIPRTNDLQNNLQYIENEMKKKAINIPEENDEQIINIEFLVQEEKELTVEERIQRNIYTKR